MHGHDHHSDTRQRLLDAAGEVFAERGFQRATVREICHKARANIAAINYHFRDKEGLYSAVLRETHREAREKYPPTLGLGSNPTPPERLRAFVLSFLLRLFDPGRPAWHGLLMAREMVEPTAAFEAVIEESTRPRYDLLLDIVRCLLGPEESEERLWLYANSVLGQCLHYHHARHVLARLHGELPACMRDVETLADHIAEFSLGAVEHVLQTTRTAPT
jgi:AcrR family transcriptional regulator